MKNNYDIGAEELLNGLDQSELEELFRHMKSWDNAFKTDRDAAIKVFCADNPRISRDDIESGLYQIDHEIPQTPHLYPHEPRHADLIEALELHTDQLKEVGGKIFYEVTGDDIIQALFDRYLPDLPRDLRPSQDNIVNLQPMRAKLNNLKSNSLSGRMDAMFRNMCLQALSYYPHLANAGNQSVLALAEEFGNANPEITRVLEAIDRIDKARVSSAANKNPHMEVAGIDLVDIFSNVSSRTGFEDGFLLPRHMAVFNKEMISSNAPVAEKLAALGMKLTTGFTGTAVDMTGNFRESYDRFRVAFISYAKSELKETQAALREVGASRYDLQPA